MHDVRLTADAAGTASLTLGLSAYAASILVFVALAVFYARRHRRVPAIAATAVVGVLTVAGLAAAIVSAVG